jgi:hypothetical protein
MVQIKHVKLGYKRSKTLIGGSGLVKESASMLVI